jgi:hypothetical protein
MASLPKRTTRRDYGTVIDAQPCEQDWSDFLRGAKVTQRRAYPLRLSTHR